MCKISLSLSLSPSIPPLCVYLYPSCIEIAGALNPGSGHEIVIPERLTLLPHLAGPRGRGLKVRKVRGSEWTSGRDGYERRGRESTEWMRIRGGGERKDKQGEGGRESLIVGVRLGWPVLWDSTNPSRGEMTEGSTDRPV